ncbi:hypothetical protein HBE96_21210 [Clostridium sp. P21]|uniref:Uncharacterized protein n=1 Tax=Clostridium muellerianum TaxID=2716538 RepID=A0A7Y0EKJ9_9CLOT|nr:hypothetical protein [Clostridium muellerianum]NMM65107.1 hypothetical protein [Clostridium muellerianum]
MFPYWSAPVIGKVTAVADPVYILVFPVGRTFSPKVMVLTAAASPTVTVTDLLVPVAGSIAVITNCCLSVKDAAVASTVNTPLASFKLSVAIEAVH